MPAAFPPPVHAECRRRRCIEARVIFRHRLAHQIGTSLSCRLAKHSCASAREPTMAVHCEVTMPIARVMATHVDRKRYAYGDRVHASVDSGVRRRITTKQEQ